MILIKGPRLSGHRHHRLPNMSDWPRNPPEIKENVTWVNSDGTKGLQRTPELAQGPKMQPQLAPDYVTWQANKRLHEHASFHACISQVAEVAEAAGPPAERPRGGALGPRGEGG